MLKNLFIEGIQGSGKSTLSRELARRLLEFHVYHEGDISPVELAWCSYMKKEVWEGMLQKYPTLADEIKAKTQIEREYYITAYTRIMAESRAFYEDMEAYEIYNGRVEFDFFHDVIMRRYAAFSEEGCVFECSFFQNSMETMLLYYQLSDEEILAFYQEAYDILKDKGFQMIYLDSEKIRENILQIKKERSDEQGNEMWYPLMMNYLKESPYGKAHNYQDFEDMIAHFERRRKLELEIIEKVLKNDCLILTAKEYDIEDVPINDYRG